MKLVATEHQVVIWDPRGTYYEGAVVSAKEAAKLQPHGVVMLPVMVEQLKASGVGGYVKRSWGAGIALDSRVPAAFGPIALYLEPRMRAYGDQTKPGNAAVSWCARLVPDAARPVELFDGMLRFTSDSSQRGPTRATYREEGDRTARMRDLLPPDTHGGWTLTGMGVVGADSEGVCGFTLYGCAPGLRLLWMAASVSVSMA